MQKFMSFVVLVLCAVLMSASAEAGSKKVRYRYKSQTSSCVSGQCGVVRTQVKTEVKTEVKTSDQSAAVVVQSGWEAAAIAEASAGAPAQHVYTASQIAEMAGYPGSSLFVGVGMNGHTCRGCGQLVADVTRNGKTVRIWLR